MVIFPRRGQGVGLPFLIGQPIRRPVGEKARGRAACRDRAAVEPVVVMLSNRIDAAVGPECWAMR